MAFTPREWLARTVQYPGRKILTPTGNTNEYDETRSEGSITQAGDIISAENLNDLETRISSAFTFEPWVAPTLLNSWVNFGGTYDVTGYFKDSFGIVHIKGFVKSGTANSIMFYLPPNYRPAGTQVFSVPTSGGGGDIYGTLSIGTDGAVKQYSVGGQVWVSLDGVSFRAA